MEINISQKQFVEVKGISHLLSNNIVDQGFTVFDQILSGFISIDLEFYSNYGEDIVKEKKEINYQILTNKDKNVLDIRVKKMEFSVIDNQGIDVLIDLCLNVEVIDEEIKKECYRELTESLEKSLDDDIAIYKDYPEGYQTIKIIFTKNEEDISRICDLYHFTLDEIYAANNYSLDNRIIINVDEL